MSPEDREQLLTSGQGEDLELPPGVPGTVPGRWSWWPAPENECEEEELMGPDGLPIPDDVELGSLLIAGIGERGWIAKVREDGSITPWQSLEG